MPGFRPFFNPATGEWIQYTATGEDNGGELVRFNWRSVPGGVITEHIHPYQEERFIVLAGEAHFTLDGEERVARAGDTVVVPAGVPHSEGNPGGQHKNWPDRRPVLPGQDEQVDTAAKQHDGLICMRARVERLDTRRIGTDFVAVNVGSKICGGKSVQIQVPKAQVEAGCSRRRLQGRPG